MAGTTTCTGATLVASSSGTVPSGAATGARMVGSSPSSGSTVTGVRWSGANGCPQTSQASPEAWTFSHSAQAGIVG